MKMLEAQRQILNAGGYRVHFELRADGMLQSDFFPDRNEPPIVELSDAWRFAEQWAQVSPLYVNIYVIYAHDASPVSGYQDLKLNVHPPAPTDASAMERTTDAVSSRRS